jgi:hypothetical protein
LAQEREYAARALGPSPLAAASSRHVVIRSPKEGCGAGSGGLNSDPPGGITCANAAFAATSAAIIVQIKIDDRFIEDMS